MFWTSNVEFNKSWKAKEVQKDWETANALSVVKKVNKSVI